MCMVRFPLLSVEFGVIVLGEKSNDKLVLFGVFSMCFKTCTVVSLLLLCGSEEAFGTCLSVWQAGTEVSQTLLTCFTFDG